MPYEPRFGFKYTLLWFLSGVLTLNRLFNFMYRPEFQDYLKLTRNNSRQVCERSLLSADLGPQSIPQVVGSNACLTLDQFLNLGILTF